MLMNSSGLRTQKGLRWLGPETNCKLQTRLLVREYVPHKQTRICLKISKEKKKKGEKLVAGHKWKPDTKTDWPTDRRS
jgi:hypothetical protein